jgi:DNA-binding CsgD family transcriptional regulator
MASVDAVGLAEAAWNADTDDGAWLCGLAAAVGKYIRASQGVAALRVRAHAWREGAGLDVAGVGSWQLSDLAMRAIGALGTRPMTVEEQHSLARAGAVATLRRALSDVPSHDQSLVDILHEAGADDCLFLTVGDPSGVCLSIAAPSVAPFELSRRLRWTLARAAAHMASSDRLRGRGPSVSALDEGADAVLSPDGRVLDARDDAKTRDAREALRDAALRCDRSRGRMRRRDPEGALELWSALVSGRWSLVDRFDSDGRRLLVARRNEPAAEAALALSAREADVVRLVAMGHGNKLIAYELGITPASVASHLANAMAKLGVTTRVELIALVDAARRRAP